jgi:nucleoside-diphosphate-sugar epimerase
VITGATGYIGSQLQRHLTAKGWSIVPIDRGMKTEQMIELLRTQKPDVVFHLASLFIAEHKPSDIEPLIASNVLFGAMLAEAMAVTGHKLLVNTGTSWQHFGPGERDPVALYSATKNAFEEILKYYVSAENFRVVTLKIFDSYGPNDPRPKLVPKLIACFDSGVTPELSPGEQKLDLVHVNDLVRAFEIAALELVAIGVDVGIGSMQDFALNSGTPVSLREVIALIERLKGRSLNVKWGARPYRRREVMEPWTKGRVLPGWETSVTLEQGLADLVLGGDEKKRVGE